MAKKAKKVVKGGWKPKPRAKGRVHKVKLAHADVIHVEAHPDVHPVVVHEKPGVIKVVAVPRKEHKPETWWHYLFVR
jgi:hypothetical protein